MGWTEAPDGVDAEVVISSLVWWTNSGPDVYYTWYAPHGASASVPFPPLPSDLAGLYTPNLIVGHEVRLETYVGTTYGDVMNGRVSDAALWSTQPQ